MPQCPSRAPLKSTFEMQGHLRSRAFPTGKQDRQGPEAGGREPRLCLAPGRPRARPGPTANQRCFQDKAGVKSEEQGGHRPDSKHKTPVVCGANAARKVHPGVSSRTGVDQTHSVPVLTMLPPSLDRAGHECHILPQSSLEVKIPCSQQREGQRRRHRCQGLRCSRVRLCFRPPSPTPGGPLPPGQESPSPGPGIGRDAWAREARFATGSRQG